MEKGFNKYSQSFSLNFSLLDKNLDSNGRGTYYAKWKKRYDCLNWGNNTKIEWDIRNINNQSFQAMVIQRKIESSLEEEANQAWSNLPEDQRLKRVGFLEKTSIWKKNQFFRTYINERFMERLKKEMELGK
ncbi:hypothetical protein CW306_00600 [Bacillus sp. BA3]|uniref:hypothetical protein n=1 Tax=Bacillus sp. BA3 TaxID=2057910 RepID=UPI000C34B838|nr:hypothetical protein [Bacillus sp. BA3]PKF90071.1 hypothetical protein CW306_00600 [Bacillus sp. BA3]